MRITRHIIPLVLLITFLFSEISLSQTINPSDYNTWAAGLKFGTLPFYGDVRQMHYGSDDPYKKINSGLAFEGIKDFNQTFGAKLQLLLGNLSGSSPNLNLHFNSNIEELSIMGIVNLNDLISFYPPKNKIINTYIFAGFGILGYRAMARTYDENNFVAGYGWDSTGAKTAMQNSTVFPLGIGIKLKANPKIDVGLELTLHLTNTNKLDAWSFNNSYNDRYSFIAVSFTYKIGKKKEYVEWVNPFKDTSKTNVVLTQQNNNTNATSVNNTISANNLNKKDTTTSKKSVSTTNNQSSSNTQIVAPPANATDTTRIQKTVWSTHNTIDTISTVKTTIPSSNYNASTNIQKATNYSSKNNDIIVSTAKTTSPTNNNITTTNIVKTIAYPSKNNDTTSIAIKTNTTVNSIGQNIAAMPVLKKFFIIAGSFPSEQEALSGVKELKSSGYSDAELVGESEVGYWRVSYKSYISREDASNGLTGIKKTDPSAWVFEKK